MTDASCPIPRFQRLQNVFVANARLGEQFSGQKGTVIWCDRPWFIRRTGLWEEWCYSVSLPNLGCCQAFLESDLRPTDEFETEQSQLGGRFEISYDTAVGNDEEVVEGSYRLPGGPWQVFLFEHGDVPEIRHDFGTWKSGITGIEFVVPASVPINRRSIEEAMSEVFEADAWVVVPGPDSIWLK
ncbi:MAG: hypothetical protein ACYC61_07120 [Isosphaeraceae bacterium]